jgi:hypothetical protein
MAWQPLNHRSAQPPPLLLSSPSHYAAHTNFVSRS